MPDDAKLLLQMFIDEHKQATTQSNAAKPRWYPSVDTDPLDVWQWLVDNGYFETTSGGLSGGVTLTSKALSWSRK
jgi:hypothetical protein